MNEVKHNHRTRNIKPPSVCPACDEIHLKGHDDDPDVNIKQVIINLKRALDTEPWQNEEAMNEIQWSIARLQRLV